jgi:hypothetical protein
VVGRAPHGVTVSVRSGVRKRARDARVVQLPVGAIDRLRTEVGKLFVFEGRLVDCDSFMRTIFVGDGQVVWARPDSHAGDRS